MRTRRTKDQGETINGTATPHLHGLQGVQVLGVVEASTSEAAVADVVVEEVACLPLVAEEEK